jgi:hypothetical protein
MNSKTLATVSGLFLASVLGYATANPATPASPAAPAAQKQDVFAAMASTKITLDDAIQTAEHTVTGKLLKAGLDSDGTSIAYKIAIADSNTRTVTYFKIAPATGKVVDSRTLHPDKQAARAANKPAPAAANKAMTPAAKAPAAKAPAAPMTSASTPAAPMTSASTPAAKAPAAPMSTTTPASKP